MTLQQAIDTLYPDPTDPFLTDSGTHVAHLDAIIRRLQHGSYIAALD